MNDNLDQREWYETIYLPLVRRMFAGEYVEPTLLHGGLLQELDDLRWDQHCDDWSKG